MQAIRHPYTPTKRLEDLAEDYWHRVERASVRTQMPGGHGNQKKKGTRFCWLTLEGHLSPNKGKGHHWATGGMPTAGGSYMGMCQNRGIEQFWP